MSDKLHYNNFYKNKIERPYADLDLSKLRWDQVMQIMQKQALAAKVQLMAKYQADIKNNRGVNTQMLPPPVPPMIPVPQPPQSVPNDLLPVHIACDYQDMPFNYSTKMNGNANSNSEESDSSSYCSSRSMSCTPTSSESESENESDIEIDVEDCSDDNMDSEDYYLMSSSMDNIPLTVIQLEHKLRENSEKS